MKRIKSKRIVLPEGIAQGYVYFDGEKIVEVSTAEHSVSLEYDVGDNYVSAGFIDIHTHGGAGNRFEGSVDEIVEGCNFHAKHGTTSIVPTVSAADIGSMERSVKNIAAAMQDKRIVSTVVGAHLEGPYLSKKQCGAQCADFITAPKKEDYLPILDRYSGAVARWTYAPENDEGGEFARALQKYGVVASAGHTDAVYADMLSASEAGCKLVTHLYSCTSTVTREMGFRRLGVIESAYLMDDVYAEIICDGKHLPPELIRLIYKIKGAERIAMVTDSLALAGSKEKHGFMQSTEFIIEDGVCKLMDRSAFAGSIATADTLLSVAVKEAGIPLSAAVRMITETPAKIMGLTEKGSLLPGFDADIVVFDSDINIKKVFARGREV